MAILKPMEGLCSTSASSDNKSPEAITLRRIKTAGQGCFVASRALLKNSLAGYSPLYVWNQHLIDNWTIRNPDYLLAF